MALYAKEKGPEQVLSGSIPLHQTLNTIVPWFEAWVFQSALCCARCAHASTLLGRLACERAGSAVGRGSTQRIARHAAGR